SSAELSIKTCWNRSWTDWMPWCQIFWSCTKQLLHRDTNQNRRTAALLGLPCYLSEDSSDVIKICDVRHYSRI
ncbi:hypothetical protein GOODEAATRI_013330, partial [Goodea atripinnis]